MKITTTTIFTIIALLGCSSGSTEKEKIGAIKQDFSEDIVLETNYSIVSRGEVKYGPPEYKPPTGGSCQFKECSDFYICIGDICQLNSLCRKEYNSALYVLCGHDHESYWKTRLFWCNSPDFF